MELDAKTYWLTDCQLQCNFDFDFDFDFDFEVNSVEWSEEYLVGEWVRDRVKNLSIVILSC
jgi:hypothetical protein